MPNNRRAPMHRRGLFPLTCVAMVLGLAIGGGLAAVVLSLASHLTIGWQP